ncbi:MAG: hypothetical protein WCA78_00280 [Rhizomicrobium sp.]
MSELNSVAREQLNWSGKVSFWGRQILQFIGVVAFGALWLGQVGEAKAATPSCTYEHAHYLLDGNADVVASFVKHNRIEQIEGDLFFFVTVKSRGWTYWFFPEAGSGYSNINLIPIGDPKNMNWNKWQTQWQAGNPERKRTFTFFGLRGDLTFLDAYPLASQAAPDLIFVPELGPHIWYDVRESGGNRYYVPRAFLKLDRCD